MSSVLFALLWVAFLSMNLIQLTDSLSNRGFLSRRIVFQNLVSGLIGSSDVANAAMAVDGPHSPPSPTLPSPTPSSNDELVKSQVSELISLIPVMPYSAPATNATINSAQLCRQIESLAASVEDSSQQRSNAESPLLKGHDWKLIYSNGAEIISLATKLPLGFQLGLTTQPIDTNGQFFENRGTLEHPFELAHWTTNVVGDLSVASKGSLNAVGVANDANNRVDVDFQVIVLVLDRVLGQKVHFQKILTPKPPDTTTSPGQQERQAVARPANDITYLDETVRIVRGGDGALFIFQRLEHHEDSSSSDYMLTFNERDALIRESIGAGRKTDVDVGIGTVEKSTSPELRFLFQERRK